MNKEVEIQVKIKNPIDAERKIRKVGKYLGCQKQKDYYFTPPDKNYFEIDPPQEYIRIRNEKGREHFGYMMTNFDKKDKFKLLSTNEYETIIEEPEALKTILLKIGLIHRVTVKKERKYFDCGKFIVTIDKIKNLGTFMEIEAKKIIKNEKNTMGLIKKFLDSLDVVYDVDYRNRGYPRQLYKKLNKKK